MGTLAPHDGKPQHPLGMIVGGRNSLSYEEKPQAIDFLVQSAGKPPRFILPVPVEGDQADETGIESSPLSHGWLSTSHMAQTLEFGQSPGPEAGNLRIFPLRELSCFTDQMSKTRLPKPNPFTVGTIAIAHEDAYPVSNQRFKGFFGTMGDES